MVRQDIPELAVEAEVEVGPPPGESGGCCLSCAQAGVAAPPAMTARLLASLVLLGFYWGSRRRN